MPLYIKDPDVAKMAEELRKLTSAPSKTEAVREALKSAIAAAARRPPLSERLQGAIELARKIGPPDPDFDQKRFFDEMWGE